MKGLPKVMWDRALSILDIQRVINQHQSLIETAGYIGHLSSSTKIIRNFGLLSDEQATDNELTFIVDAVTLHQFLKSPYRIALAPFLDVAVGLVDLVCEADKLLITIAPKFDPMEAFYRLWSLILPIVGAEPIGVTSNKWGRGDTDYHVLCNRPLSVVNGSYIGNTIIHKETICKPGSIIGGEGFQVIGRRLVPHTGLVIIDAGCSIGSSVTIDRGLFGTVTYIGPGVCIDNKVHIGHNSHISGGTTITAGCTIAGSTYIGQNSWIGIGSNLRGHIGEEVYVGMGSNIVSPIPDHACVYGNPAKIKGWVCCNQPIHQIDLCGFISVGSWAGKCQKCGKVFSINDTKQTCVEVYI